MTEVRLHFSKTFDAKYISHLDLMRCFGRALKMSGLPVWYTEGFNPHVFMTFALPLSLGVESLCEIADFRLLDDTVDPYIKEKINSGLPVGLEVFNATQPKLKHNDIAWSRYIVELSGTVSMEKVRDAAESLFSRDVIMVTKKTKKKCEKEVDVKQQIGQYKIGQYQDTCFIDLTLAAGSENYLSPGLLVSAVIKSLNTPPGHQLIKRVQIFDKEGRNFE